MGKHCMHSTYYLNTLCREYEILSRVYSDLLYDVILFVSTTYITLFQALRKCNHNYTM